jgi:hypothetical protein
MEAGGQTLAYGVDGGETGCGTHNRGDGNDIGHMEFSAWDGRCLYRKEHNTRSNKLEK